MKVTFNISTEDLIKDAKIPVEIFENEFDLYYDIAITMLEEVAKNNKEGKSTAFICPVGPIGQYKRLAYFINKYRVDFSNVYIFNMDEYLTDDDKMISPEHPLSFKGFMDREFYNLINEELNVKPENRFFPEPGKEDYIWDKIQEVGGIDICFGGIGINGHIAFNEPGEDGVSVEEFAEYKTRILDITKETKTVNAVMTLGGAIDYLPSRCITIGMKEILSSRKLRFYMNRFWQKSIVRKILHSEVTPNLPATYLQIHPDAKLSISSLVAEQPLGKLL